VSSRLRLIASVGFLGLGIAGCGGSSDNGVAKLQPAAILARAKAAADRASSVHAAGSIDSDGSKTAFDLDLAAGRGGGGQLSEGGLGFALIAIGKTAYVKGSPAFYARFAGPAAASALEGKWLEASTTTPGFTGLGTLTDQRILVDTALGDAGTLSLAGTATVDGQPAIRLRAPDGGIYYVATTGTPYPVEVAKPGTNGGTIVFDHWSSPVRLTAPANPVDVNTLKRAVGAGGG
jgi:hypothetical protein